MAAETSIVMPEVEWFKLCAKMCRARRKRWGGTLSECREKNECGICPECADDAIGRAPAKYRTTSEVADRYDRLPGCFR